MGGGLQRVAGHIVCPERLQRRVEIQCTCRGSPSVRGRAPLRRPRSQIPTPTALRRSAARCRPLSRCRAPKPCTWAWCGRRTRRHPKILFHARFPQYVPNDMADPALVDLAIARGAFTTAGLQFNTSLRDVLHGFDPFLGLGHESHGRRLVPAAHLRRLPDAPGPEPERADAHRGQSHDGTAAAVRHQPP